MWRKLEGRKRHWTRNKKTRYDLHAKDLKPFKTGTKVWVQNSDTREWDSTAKILERTRDRTYKIELENGRVTFRNRKRMRRKQEFQHTMPSERNHDRSPNTMKESPKDMCPKPRRSERIRVKNYKQ